jgi:hypothetical protein
MKKNLKLKISCLTPFKPPYSPLFFLPISTLLVLTILPPSPISIQYFVLPPPVCSPSHSSYSPNLILVLPPFSLFFSFLFFSLPCLLLSPLYISPFPSFPAFSFNFPHFHLFPLHFSLLISIDLHIPILSLSLFILPLLLPFHFIFPPFLYPFSLFLHFH